MFLPVVFTLYWCLCGSRRWQNLLLLVASYVFYGWWDWRFLLLIAFTSLCSYASGLFIYRLEGQRKKQRYISAANIVVNLGILGVFKYCDFFIDNLNSLLQAMGWHIDNIAASIILPVGISFYTFQALSYSIDVYQHKIRPTHDPIEFFAYISFFPQLVAGPIERATNLLPQFQRNRKFSYPLAVDGMRQILWGFVKKLVIADGCAAVVNDHWNEYQHLPGFMLLLLGVLFTFQIYCDFSGYSDIAIGTARLFGFNLMQNFCYPYFSRSIPDFWRRWHISLTTWFRDYIYFPLGGSRCKKRLILRNIFVVWAVSGMWHGANWTFVCWGLYHASLLAVYVLLGINTKYDAEDDRRPVPGIRMLGQMVLTFMLAVIGWIIFRAETMTQALDYFKCMLTNVPYDASMTYGRGWLVFGVVLLVAEWFQRDKQHALQAEGSRVFAFRAMRWAVYYAILLVIFKFAGSSQTFIYFQF